MIEECEKEIEKQLLSQIAAKNEGVIPEYPRLPRKVSVKNKMSFDATSMLHALQEIDVTEIEGISEVNAISILSEVGLDMTKWKSVKQYLAWLNVVPNTKISNKKIISSRMMNRKNHAGQAFRMAAKSVRNAKGPLGEFYRKIRAKSGPGTAVVATAHKIAVIYYNMMLKKEAYNPKALIENQKKYKEKKVEQLKKKLAILEAA
jgi:hypothetical protein